MSSGLTLEAPQGRLSREVRIGVGAAAFVVAIRVVIGNFVVNDWEGWGTFVPTATGAAIEGLLLLGVVFGLVVRLAARSHGDWPGVVALGVGTVALLSLAIPYSAPQALVGAGAVALGLVARDRTDGRASQWLGWAAVAIGLVVIATWLGFVVTTIVTGDWPDVTP